jgi:hypothetical protein
MKDHYYAQLAEYKKTQEYSLYQDYLADFKAKHEHGSKSRSLDLCEKLATNHSQMPKD